LSSFNSVSDILKADTELWLTRKWHWMSGNALPIDWNQVNSTGVGVFAMVDAVNEGFSIATSANADDSNISYNGIDHFNPVASTFIGDFKAVNANTLTEIGLQDNASAPAGASDFVRIRINRNLANIFALSRNTSTTSLDLGVAVSSNFINGRAVMGASNSQFSLDGVLVGTITTNRPTVKMQPMFRCFTIVGTNAEARIKFFEVFAS
jgi:hypothetical protein